MRSRKAIVAGSAGIAVAALGYRAWDRGVLAGATGPAYVPWDEWRGSDADGNRRPLRAAILAASPHDTPSQRFRYANDMPRAQTPAAALSAPSAAGSANAPDAVTVLTAWEIIPSWNTPSAK